MWENMRWLESSWNQLVLSNFTCLQTFLRSSFGSLCRVEDVQLFDFICWYLLQSECVYIALGQLNIWLPSVNIHSLVMWRFGAGKEARADMLDSLDFQKIRCNNSPSIPSSKLTSWILWFFCRFVHLVARVHIRYIYIYIHHINLSQCTIQYSSK